MFVDYDGVVGDVVVVAVVVVVVVAAIAAVARLIDPLIDFECCRSLFLVCCPLPVV